MTTMDLTILRYEHFQARIGETFMLHVDGGICFGVVLVEASESNSPALRDELQRGRRSRLPFQMTFRAPLEPELPQRIYQLRHPELGTLDLFLVPVERRDDAMWYEAVFT